MGKQTLNDWLARLNKSEIKLGLSRTKLVYQKLILSLNSTIITIGGTNGKGSTAAFIEQIYLTAGFNVGKLSSPELLVFNEQIRLNGINVSDERITTAFELITKVKGDIDLSYFEYLTLAALWIFKQAKTDIIILEVGLGGRLDAVNVVDCNCAIITNIGLDHKHFLGTSRTAIAKEKVAIARHGSFFICGDDNPPKEILNYLQNHRINAIFINTNYQGKIGLLGNHQRRNAQLAKTAVKQLSKTFYVSDKTIKDAIADTKLLGRLSCVDFGGKTWILDLAHNADASATLVDFLEQTYPDQTFVALFSALKDKNITAITAKISHLIYTWYLCDLDDERFSRVAIKTKTQIKDGANMVYNQQIQAAITAILASPARLIVVFGSFKIVAKTLQYVR